MFLSERGDAISGPAPGATGSSSFSMRMALRSAAAASFGSFAAAKTMPGLSRSFTCLSRTISCGNEEETRRADAQRGWGETQAQFTTRL